MTAVSIVITNHDHGRFVAQAIDSALAQTHAGVEVVVVDDGSTDDSRRIIEGYHDAVRVWFREQGGQARAMLDGFRRSCGEVVLFLDGDDVLYPDAYPDYRTGDHREQGAFWITGPGIAARALASPVSITDFAPTIGALLGVPLPGLDGRPIPGVAGGRSRESA